jgi:hypothetical protein
MTAAVASSNTAYRTTTSCVAVHFDEAGKGQIVFLPCGVALRIIGPSCSLPGGCQVMFENRLYDVFEVDLLARSIPICERILPKGRAIGACA